jgi:hypothetical protein
VQGENAVFHFSFEYRLNLVLVLSNYVIRAETIFLFLSRSEYSKLRGEFIADPHKSARCSEQAAGEFT